MVQRENLLEQADKILSDLAGGKALLEVSFEDEVSIIALLKTCLCIWCLVCVVCVCVCVCV